jgi:hypothetical protein
MLARARWGERFVEALNLVRDEPPGVAAPVQAIGRTDCLAR